MNSLQRRRKSRRIVQGVLSVILLLGTMLWAGETRMPQGLWEALTQARYGVRTEKTGAYLAINHRYDYRTRFDQKGIELFPSDPEASWSVKMRLEALDGERLPVAKVERHGTKLSYLRGRVTEWYDNRSKGLEQGFTITTPSTKTPEKVELSLTIETTLKVEQKGDALIFKDSKGDERLRYAKLHAYDATHKALPSRMILEGRTLTLQVETRGVRWPVTVDPLFTTQAKVVADTSQVKDFFGCSVSLDGNRVLIGAYKDDDRGTDSGAVYLFEYDGSAWTQRAKLTAADGADDDYFGISVSLSGDRALVGAYGDDDRGSNSGSAYFFDYDDGVWTQSAKLTADDGAEGDKFGCSVSLLGDRALVGAKGDKNGGSAYIFDFDGSTWRQKIKLTVQGGGSDNFGCSVSLVEDRALIGAYLNNERGAAYIFDYDGSAWTQSAKLTADDGAAYDYFGNSVSLSGDRALIGAVYDDDNGSSSGSAYLFDYDGSTWIQRVKLTASDAVANDRFGTSVSLDGNRALIGADNRGFAYIFEYDGTAWQQSDKLIADDRGAGDMFGCSVSLSGDRALIGSSWDNDRGTFSGSAYIFDYDGSAWSQSAKLVADDGASDDWFGYAVSLSGKRVLIGAYRDDDRGVDSGAAYLFDYNGSDWIQSVKLTASDGAAEDWFGYAVSLSGDRALIGAHYDDDRGTKSGSAYIFDYDGSAWSQRAKLTASDGAAYDYFGKSVSLSGNRALIGAYGDDDQGSKSGSAYIFDYDGSTWNQSAKLTADDGEEDDWFGRSVSLSGNRALIGAYGDNDVQGSAYIFDYDGSTWSQHAKLTADDGENDDRFGWSVSLSGDRALIGAYRDDDLGSRSGSAYLFEYNGTAWSQRVKFTADDGAAGEYFGWSVSLSGDRALIGAYRDDDLGSKAGLPTSSPTMGRPGGSGPNSPPMMERKRIGLATPSASSKIGWQWGPITKTEGLARPTSTASLAPWGAGSSPIPGR